MRTLLATPRWVLLACGGLIAITWLDVLDLIETVTLLETPGYAEANVILTLAGRSSLVAVKALIPLLIGAILLVSYRRSARLFRTVTSALWLAVLPYAAVVTHNLLFLLAR